MSAGIPQTFFLEELVPKPFPSVDWLSRRLTKGDIPGRKIGRRWVMTAQDVQAALDLFQPTQAPTPPAGQSAASVRRRRAS